MARILLTRNRVNADDLDIRGEPFAVVAPGYEAPRGIPVVELVELLAEPSRLGQPGTMVVVGLSRLLTPTNRVKLGQVLLRPREGLHRVSVDSVLFVNEPWRAFWHFFSTRIGYQDFTDSFLAESRWKSAHEMQTADPFSLEELVKHGTGHIEARDAFTIPAFNEVVVSTSPETREAYDTEKTAAFEEETSLPAILTRLGRVAAAAVPQRRFPSKASLYKPGAARIVRSDLPVDVYLSARLHEIRDITNGIAAHFAE